ncbi:MAG TPA: DUF5829 family protein [Myxococcales bacterium]|nr:DUF5829 family protein [Myxococcales bacterium]
MTAAAPVLLNHFYVTPDRATFAAVEGSAFVQGFAAVEKRTTVRKDTTYTGLYLYGESTYFELLHPDSASFGAPSGIAYAVEERGGMRAVAAALGAEPRTVTRGEVSWFLLCEPPRRMEALSDWAMEYLPEFFAGFHPEQPPAHPGISRADALTRYAASCGKLLEREQGLFAEVVTLELRLGPEDMGIWSSRPLRLRGVEVHALPAEGRSGILSARLRLRRDAGKSVQQLGSTTLTLDGRDAVWRF